MEIADVGFEKKPVGHRAAHQEAQDRQAKQPLHHAVHEISLHAGISLAKSIQKCRILTSGGRTSNRAWRADKRLVLPKSAHRRRNFLCASYLPQKTYNFSSTEV